MPNRLLLAEREARNEVLSEITDKYDYERPAGLPARWRFWKAYISETIHTSEFRAVFTWYLPPFLAIEYIRDWWGAESFTAV